MATSSDVPVAGGVATPNAQSRVPDSLVGAPSPQAPIKISCVDVLVEALECAAEADEGRRSDLRRLALVTTVLCFSSGTRNGP